MRLAEEQLFRLASSKLDYRFLNLSHVLIGRMTGERNVSPNGNDDLTLLQYFAGLFWVDLSARAGGRASYARGKNRTSL